MTDDELLHHLKTHCFGKSNYTSGKNLICKFGIRESDLRKRVNRLRSRAVPIASSREGYFYAANAGELYATIRQLREMRAGLDAAISGLEQAMEQFSEANGGESHRETIYPVDRE